MTDRKRTREDDNLSGGGSGLPIRVQRSSNVAQGGEENFTIYDSDWSSTGELISVKVELGDYTANKKGYAQQTESGNFVLINSECA